ncbi:acetyl esterase/lipase [Streptomyces sp. 3212.3]|uniref:alpha/beta hydrolase fold domain-containing protein n=1 Tax=unclassified Streptomyces TaxID=2593676 RepID=UPI000E3A2895|nr:alpha/beta hydrolase [Streptomyces sp. 3212.3]REE66280.1 acetyl esterase/lipase [Streptomyces sp. 3212.3]
MPSEPIAWPPAELALPPVQLPPTAPTTAADGVRRYDGLSYATNSGYRPRLLDLSVPAAAEPPAVVVWIHGGAWMEGDRRHPPPTVSADLLFGSLLRAGLAVATIDYRHAREAPFPAQLHDIKAAIRYLRHYAGTLGIARTRIGLWGESAGGHLAALAGLTDAVHPSLEGTEGIAQGDTTVGAVVDWYGITDVGALLPDAPGPHDPFVTFLGGDPADRPHLAAAASPVSYARFPAPPFLLVHGTHDTLVPFEHSERLAGLLRAAGNHAELVAVPGAEHIFLNADVAPVVARCVAFLAHHLRRPATDRTAGIRPVAQ